MKKAFALLLALVMVLSLAACGSGSTTTNTPTQTGTVENTPAPAETSENTPTPAEVETPATPEPTEEPKAAEYAIGEAFGTDNVECKVLSFKWITPEEFDSISKRTPSAQNGENIYVIEVENFFPESVDSFGSFGGLKSKLSETYFLLVEFSLRNIGKTAIERTTEWDGQIGRTLPYGVCVAIYDDGFEFSFGGERSGFTTSLGVLADAVKVVGGCALPKQVYENESNSLLIKVSLPNSAGETEEFLVTVR